MPGNAAAAAFFLSSPQSFPGSQRSTCCYCSRSLPTGRPSWENTVAGPGSARPHGPPEGPPGAHQGSRGTITSRAEQLRRFRRTSRVQRSSTDKLFFCKDCLKFGAEGLFRGGNYKFEPLSEKEERCGQQGPRAFHFNRKRREVSAKYHYQATS